jgi:hypothetical protein
MLAFELPPKISMHLCTWCSQSLDSSDKVYSLPGVSCEVTGLEDHIRFAIITAAVAILTVEDLIEVGKNLNLIQSILFSAQNCIALPSI